MIDGRSLIKGSAVLIVALAWNEAAKKFIDYLFPLDKGDSLYTSMVATIVYAVFVSIMVVLIIAVYNYTNVKLSGMVARRQSQKNGIPMKDLRQRNSYG